MGTASVPVYYEESEMADITASMVKDLRERTGLGMMDCKKALVEANGDAELAIENLRKSSGMKAAKKAGRTAADGTLGCKIEGGTGVLAETPEIYGAEHLLTQRAIDKGTGEKLVDLVRW